MEGACWGKENASGSGARLLQWSKLLVPAVPVIALTTDITLTRTAHAGKGAWQLRLFTHLSCYARILQCPQAPPGETLYTSQENSSEKQWRNLSFSTVSHILFCMLESLEPWGNIFVSCLVPFQSHCNLLNALLLMFFSDRYLSTFFFSPSQAQDALRVTGEERRKLLTC